MTFGLVAGSTNRVLSTGVSVDTQPYATPSSEGNRKLNSAIPRSEDALKTPLLVVILLASVGRSS